MHAYLRSLVRIQSGSFKNRNRRSVAVPLKDSKSKLNKQRKALTSSKPLLNVVRFEPFNNGIEKGSTW